MLSFFKRLVFGSSIHRTVDEVAGLKAGIGLSLIRVHTLNNGYVGLELVTKIMLSHQMLPITLASESARARRRSRVRCLRGSDARRPTVINPLNLADELR
jgi:hypothetical protein